MGIRSSRCQRPSILKSPARSCNRTRHLAATENRSVQALLAEASDLLFPARGLAPLDEKSFYVSAAAAWTLWRRRWPGCYPLHIMPNDRAMRRRCHRPRLLRPTASLLPRSRPVRSCEQRRSGERHRCGASVTTVGLSRRQLLTLLGVGVGVDVLSDVVSIVTNIKSWSTPPLPQR